METAERPLGKNGKPLWGAPLKVHQLEERVKELESELDLRRAVGPAIAMRSESYPLVDMWPSPPGMDPPMSKTGHQFYHGSTVKDSGEFVYFEQMDFYSDSGYNAQSLFDRIVKMAGRAIGDTKTDSGLKRRRERLGPPLMERGKQIDDYDYSTLPEFRKGNRIEVRVRILPAS